MDFNKTSKFGFNITFNGERVCTSKKEVIIENFVPQKFPAIQYYISFDHHQLTKCSLYTINPASYHGNAIMMIMLNNKYV